MLSISMAHSPYGTKGERMNLHKSTDNDAPYPPGTQIAEITYRTVRIPLRQPFRFAATELTSLPYAWVRIVTRDGVIGFGEAPTHWDPTGETQLAAIGAFELWKAYLVGRSVFAIREICSFIERISRGAYAARCAIETAILDACTKIHSIPAVDMLGGIQNSVKVNAVIGLPKEGIPEADERFAEVTAKVNAGFRTIKIKSSAISFERDVELVQKIHDRFGDTLTLFVDANQSWGDAYQAHHRIDICASLGVRWIEQPINAQDVSGHQYLRSKASLPVMLDESVTDYVSLANCIAVKAVQYANLKLAKTGGPFSALKFISVADAHAIPYIIGSMIESGLGMLANYHVARASQPLSCDFDAYWLVDDGLDVGFVQTGEYLERKNDRKPGLGYDLAQIEHMFARGRTV
jgi:L-alanine-DL-glutamate epimerase-like enolase superfamily enzyme